MRAFVAVAVAVAVGLGTAVSPFASPAPDGLERVAADRGFEHAAAPSPAQRTAPAPGYRVPAVEDERLATALSGFVGTLALFGLCAGVGVVLRRRAAARPASPPEPAR